MGLKKYIKFELRPDLAKPKTQVYDVKTNNGEFLGQIMWFFRWRQYCFYPADDTVWSRGCLQQVLDFIQKLMDDRKNEKI